jgi:hypothetical protein
LDLHAPTTAANTVVVTAAGTMLATQTLAGDTVASGCMTAGRSGCMVHLDYSASCPSE